MNLDRTEKRKGKEMTIDRLGIVGFAIRHFEESKKRNTRWNGRQIRNAFQTATALAEYEAAAAQKAPATLEVSHFESVAEASLQFDMYIAETIGADAAQRALLERTRADNFRWTVRDRDAFSSSGPSHGSYQDLAPYTNKDFLQSLFSPLHAFDSNHNPSPSNFTQGERHSVHGAPQWPFYPPSAPEENADYDYGNNPSHHISGPVHRRWQPQHAQGRDNVASTGSPLQPPSKTASDERRHNIGPRISNGRDD